MEILEINSDIEDNINHINKGRFKEKEKSIIIKRFKENN